MKIVPTLLAVSAVDAYNSGYKSRFQKSVNVCDYEWQINNQIEREMAASNFYYALKFKFATQNNNRPNFSEMLGKRAAEEMDHATMLANFQLSRGYDVKIHDIEAPDVSKISNMEQAINEMIAKETEITTGNGF